MCVCGGGGGGGGGGGWGGEGGQIFHPFSEAEGFCYKRKKNVPPHFAFKIDPFSEGVDIQAGKQKVNSCLPCKMAEKYPVYLVS